jgi:hypothetical protein
VCVLTNLPTTSRTRANLTGMAPAPRCTTAHASRGSSAHSTECRRPTSAAQTEGAPAVKRACARGRIQAYRAHRVWPSVRIGATGSTDDVRNGVALAPTFHRAFDHGLIYLDENYFMHLNPQQELQLTTLNLHDGLLDFRSLLGRRIHLPADQHQWPDTRLIRQANRHRRVG